MRTFLLNSANHKYDKINEWFSLPGRCTVATMVKMPGTTNQTPWGSLNKPPAHSSALAAAQRGTKSTGWWERLPGIKKIIYCDYLESLTQGSFFHTDLLFIIWWLKYVIRTLLSYYQTRTSVPDDSAKSQITFTHNIFKRAVCNIQEMLVNDDTCGC